MTCPSLIVLRKYHSLTWKFLQDILSIFFCVIHEIYVALIHEVGCQGNLAPTRKPERIWNWIFPWKWNEIFNYFTEFDIVSSMYKASSAALANPSNWHSIFMESGRWGETVLSGLGGTLKVYLPLGGGGLKFFTLFGWGTIGFSLLGVVPPSLARNRLPPPKVHTPLPPSSLNNNFHVIIQ